MIIGTKSDFDKFVELIGPDTPQVIAVALALRWVVPDSIWVIREPNDGPFEANIEARAIKTGVVPKLTFSSPGGRAEREQARKDAIITKRNRLAGAIGLVREPGQLKPDEIAVLDHLFAGNVTAPVSRKTPVDYKSPPIKPPTGFKKVASLWKAVTGPRLDTAGRDARLSQCTKYGGYTWSPVDGVVSEVVQAGPTTQLTIGGRTIELPGDERPSVTVGDRVTLGQVVATGDSVKPCQFLIEKPTQDPSRTANLYCNACGCGVKKVAELHSKLAFANLTCPRLPPLFKAQS